MTDTTLVGGSSNVPGAVIIRGDMWFVLVHSPLIGVQSWAHVANRLEQRGHDVVVPSLSAATQSDGVLWRAQVEAVAGAVPPFDTHRPVWLVGHSGAGPLLPAIGDAIGSHVVRYVFVDAALPHPGLSRLEALPPAFADRLRSLDEGGWLPPWSKWFGPGALEQLIPDPKLRSAFIEDLPRIPIRLFEERLPDISGWTGSQGTYIRLSHPYRREADEAAGRGWPVSHVDGDHLWPITHPDDVAGALEASAEGTG
jgi:hypothetical protein